MKRKILEQIIVHERTTIQESLARMDSAGQQILLVVDDEKRLCGVVTDGDFRRFILRNESLNVPVSSIMTANFTALNESSKSDTDHIFGAKRINHIPIVDDQGRVVDLASRLGLIQNAVEDKELPVVIMAGGMGTRLSPLTRIIPKPLMPVGDTTMLELILEKFSGNGFKRFYVIVNYKKELIKSYCSESAFRYAINFIDEQKFLGTAGGLKLLQGTMETPFVLTNCDVIANVNYESLLNWHCSQKADLTILAVRKRVDVPYGVISVDHNNYVAKIEEKPGFNFMIMSGIYIMEPSLLSLIPDGTSYGMDQLIADAILKARKVACYPVESGWFDMGQFEEYKQLLNHFGVLSA